MTLDKNGDYTDIVSVLREVAQIKTNILYSRRLMLNQAANTIETLTRERDEAREALKPMLRKYALGDRLRKIKGSSWQGRVVGFYSTAINPVGYVIESEREPGSAQLYPEVALEPVAGGKQE